MSSYKRYINDATVVNHSDSYNHQGYLVALWQGSGYLLDLFVVYAFDPQDALEILVNYLADNGISRFFVDLSDLTPEEREEAEGYGQYIWVDGYYIYGENLSIEEI